jgi:hypothetical protein
MKLKVSRKLPSTWKKHPAAEGLLAEGNLKIGKSRLAAKLLIFDRPASLRHFWKNGLNRFDLGKGCQGAVTGYTTEKWAYPNGKEIRWLEADNHYFCIIGLCATHLSMEIVCHESVHAGLRYIERVKKTPWDSQIGHFAEERMAYPIGAIAREINAFLFRYNLYEIGERLKE